MKRFLLICLILFTAFNIFAQEEGEDGDDEGGIDEESSAVYKKGKNTYNKHLSNNLTDHWIINGRKGEVLIVFIRSSSFDPVLKLLDEKGKVLLDIDDRGSESQFAIRLPKAGKYEIHIHAYKFKGGGNYSLRIDRFTPSLIQVGETIVNRYGKEGYSYYYFKAKRGDIFIPYVKSSSYAGWNVKNSKGKSVKSIWRGGITIQEDGEYYLILTGKANLSYTLLFNKAKIHKLVDNEKMTASISKGEMDVWTFKAKRGEVKALEIVKNGILSSRLIYNDPESKKKFLAPKSKENDIKNKRLMRMYQKKLNKYSRLEKKYKQKANNNKRFLRRSKRYQRLREKYQKKLNELLREEKGSEDIQDVEWDTLRFFPTGSKGNYLRYTAVFGENGTYQLQVKGESKVKYTIRVTNPIKSLISNNIERKNIDVGGSVLYRFKAKPGQLFQMNVTSNDFDPFLRFYDKKGKLLLSNDDDGQTLGSQLTWLVRENGEYIIQVSSLGNGGGGAFELDLKTKEIKELRLDERKIGKLTQGNFAYWHFKGKKNITVIISVKSEILDPSVYIYGPDGVNLAYDNNSGIGNNALLPIQLDKDGRYTIKVQAEKGQGQYSIRLINED